MCNGRFGLVRHRFGWKQFCCKACLDTYLTCTTREAHRCQASVLAKLDVAFATEQRVAAFGSAAARLMRAYATQVEVLRRLRNGGQQFVNARLLFQLKQKLLSLTEVRTEAASVSTSSDKPPIEMIIGDWYLGDLGNPTREIRRRD